MFHVLFTSHLLSPEADSFYDITLLNEISSDDDIQDMQSGEDTLAERSKAGNEKDEAHNVTVHSNVLLLKAPEMPAKPQLESKHNKERKRRSEINKAFDKLTELIFVIDPQLKERARKNLGDMNVQNQALSRVELVTSTVAILAHIHHDSEAHKLLLAHLLRGPVAGNGEGECATPTWSLTPLPPHFILPPTPASSVSSKSDANTEEGQVPKEESRSERKRRREQIRRDGVNKRLELLAELIFWIDPNLTTKRTCIQEYLIILHMMLETIHI